MISEDIFTIESHLLFLAIRLRLLFLYLLPYLIEDLKELIFALLQWLGTGSWFLQRGGANVLDGTRLIVRGWGGRVPSDSMAFPLNVSPLMVRFLGVVIDLVKAF